VANATVAESPSWIFQLEYNLLLVKYGLDPYFSKRAGELGWHGGAAGEVSDL